jgi:hypothetical protein
LRVIVPWTRIVLVSWHVLRINNSFSESFPSTAEGVGLGALAHYREGRRRHIWVEKRRDVVLLWRWRS